MKPETQIHTHMCYSEFTDIIPAIDDMDADVITFEASRSDLQILQSLKENHFKTEVGPGVYDIHNLKIKVDAGIAYAVDRIVDLIAQGVDGIHLYTMNNAYIAGKIHEAICNLTA